MTTTVRWRSRADNSMLTPLLMWPLRFIYPMLRRAGVDIPRCEAIIRNQLLLDQYGGKTNAAAVSGVYMLMMAGYWLIGMMAAVPTAFIAMGKIDVAPGLWLGGCQSVLVPLLGFPLAMKYADLFIDATDIHIVAPTPVNNATLFAARLVHAALYTGVLAACFSFGPFLVGLFAYPWLAVLVIYPVATLLTVLFVVSGVGLIYGLALRVFGPQRFERAALWIQVILASLAMGGGNVAMHSPPVRSALEAIIENPALIALIPTLHAGALLDIASGLEITTARLTMAALAFIIPVAMTAVAVRLAARQFLAGLLGHRIHETTQAGWPTKSNSFVARFARTPIERAMMPVTRAVTRRDPMAVRALWPQVIAIAVVCLVIPSSSFGGLAELDFSPKWFALVLFFGAIMDVAIIDTLRITENDGAAWLYTRTSDDQHPEILRGSVKAVFFGILVPLKVLLIVVLSITLGPDVLLAAVLSTVASTALSLRLVHQPKARLPFTLTPTSSMNQGYDNIDAYILTFVALTAGCVACGALLLHWIATVAGILVALPYLVRGLRRLDDLECEALSLD